MDIEAWFTNIPLVTKVYMVSAIAASVAVTFDLVSPLSLYLNHTLIWKRGQYWRLLTNFVFFDRMGINFFFHMHFLYFYCRRLEEHFYFHKVGEFVFMLASAMGILLALSSYLNTIFLSSPLVMVILYLWSRRFPEELLQIYGLFTVTSAYMPYVMVGFSYMMGGAEETKLNGIAIIIGHFLWYMADVFPMITGWHPMSPSFFVALLARQREHVE